jgi:uncharacterized protein (DUF2147 family)
MMPTLNAAQTATVSLTVPNAYLTVDCSSGAVVEVSWVSAGSISGRRTVQNISEDVGPFVDQTVVTLYCRSGTASYSATGDQASQAATQALVAGAWKRTEALYKYWGSNDGPATGGVFNKTTGLSGLVSNLSLKMELEAGFTAVRMLWVNRAANAITGNKALIGTTETNATGTSDLLSVPTIGGTSYPVVAGGSTTLGFRSTTWAGAATIDLPAANAAQQFKLSDWTPITDVPRTDGGARPLYLQRVYHDGATLGNYAFVALTTAIRVATAPMRQRTMVCAERFATDAVATPNASMALSTGMMEVYPIVRHKVPVLSVWGIGNSITQCDGLVADKVTSWGLRACLDVSTPARPVVWANWGASSVDYPVYIQPVKDALAAGVPAPSVFVTNAGCINSLSATPNARIVETMRAQALDLIALAKQYDVPFILWWPVLPFSSLDAGEDALRVAFNTEMRAVAAAYGITWLSEFAALGDGATPERWLPAKSGDGLHPNEPTIDTDMASALASTLRALMV